MVDTEALRKRFKNDIFSYQDWERECLKLCDVIDRLQDNDRQAGDTTPTA